MKNIPMVSVRSSHLKSVGYNPTARTMAVKFNDGGTYHYYGVTPNTHDQFMAAPSKGKFFRRAIKGRYRTVDVSIP